MNVKRLSIKYTDEDSEHTVAKFYDEFTPWSYMLQDFCKFLESAGYINVMSKVGIQDSPFLDVEWQGAVMNEDGTWSESERYS